MFRFFITTSLLSSPLVASAETVSSTLEEARTQGALRSSYLNQKLEAVSREAPQPDMQAFHAEIEPLLEKTCYPCHGPDKQKGEFRIDTLNPNLVEGGDELWWLDVMDVVTKGEMPPEDADVAISDEERGIIVDWLTNEVHVASQVRRSEEGHSSFRRMTRYEYNFALQDLLGLPYDFAKNLPPETASEDGFENSSEMLQMSVKQFEKYRELGRAALEKATVRGDRPAMVYYGITMDESMAKRKDQIVSTINRRIKSGALDPEDFEKELEKQTQQEARNTTQTHYLDLETGEGFRAGYRYSGAKQAHAPSRALPNVPPVLKKVVVVPSQREIKFDLGDWLPDSGDLRVRVRASRTSDTDDSIPSLRLFFGFQASNNSEGIRRIGNRDIPIKAPPGKPQFYEWTIPLGETPRNLFRGIQKMGDIPNPTEFLEFQNVHRDTSKNYTAGVQIDYVEVIAPVYQQWPPESHTRVFIDSKQKADENRYAREVLAAFMPRAWRRPVTDAEIDQKLELFRALRPVSDDFQEAMIETLAGVISSPKFLYLVQHDSKETDSGPNRLSEYELATRLSMFLWSSVPDMELRELAEQRRLSDPTILAQQTKRLLADPRSERFANHFTRQWLGMQLLDYLVVDEEVNEEFDSYLKEAMQNEPVALFLDALRENRSVLDFLHADYVIINERLAQHYGIPGVHGTDFQKVDLPPEDVRGGLLTQPGLLAMNSDGKDSHPLKRGIWLLESLLDDPPPPPPAAVPEIDLSDPEILKLTLKERMEDHRNDPACYSCHAKIDPWGIAFENFDATGSWRDTIDGKPVDASAKLFNKQDLNGIDGLKRFLLENRQDQFCRAITYKLATYALGRPLSFADRASIDDLAAKLRHKGDGLTDLISLIVSSDLFLTK
jgi:mono/diheme cytochrome c family protein